MSPPTAAEPAPSDRLASSRSRPWVLIAAAVAGAALLALGVAWLLGRSGHSRTEDVFLEAHIVNVAPQLVSGRIIRVLADENDRVAPGQVLAEIDPVPYQDKVAEARLKVKAAEATLDQAQASLGVIRKEVPIQIEISRQSHNGAMTDRVKAEKSLALTRQQVDRAIDEAQAGVKAARADMTLADEEYGRFTRLYQQEASTQRQAQEVAKAREAALAELKIADTKLSLAMAQRLNVDLADASVSGARTGEAKAGSNVSLSETGYDQLHAQELLVEVRKREVDMAREALRSAEHDLEYTRIRAPFPGVVVKRYRNLGDFAAPGASVMSMYNPDLLYAEANLEETRLPGVSPGNPVTIHVDAFDKPFRGRVLWINKSTGAEFALMPRNVVSGEFTHVVQRVGVRIWVEPDDRWDQLRAGLSAHVEIDHAGADPAWADRTARALAELETRFNQPSSPDSPDEASAKIPTTSPGPVRR